MTLYREATEAEVNLDAVNELSYPIRWLAVVPVEPDYEASAAWGHQEQCRRSGTDLPWEVAYPSEQDDYRNIARHMVDAALGIGETP